MRCCRRLAGKAAAIIGMRRAGKTSFLHQCRADRIHSGHPAHRQLYFNFEDERLAGLEASQLHLIPDSHLRLFPEPANEPVALFLDEIQLIPGWETFVRRLLDTPGHEVFLSGSSAKLLSREIASSMRGRAWEVPVHPFSFREYLRHHGHEIPSDPGALTTKASVALDHRFARYLESGGFPEAQSLEVSHRRQLLQGCIDVLLLRDVIERHQVANATALRWLVRRLLGSPAGLFSVTKFSADLRSRGHRGFPRASLSIPGPPGGCLPSPNHPGGQRFRKKASGESPESLPGRSRADSGLRPERQGEPWPRPRDRRLCRTRAPPRRDGVCEDRARLRDRLPCAL